MKLNRTLCTACNKTVYKLEELRVDKAILHKDCFKCTQCKGRLSLGNFASVNSKFYCKAHYMEIFRESGGSYSAFGDSGFKQQTSKQKQMAGSAEGKEKPAPVKASVVQPLRKTTPIQEAPKKKIVDPPTPPKPVAVETPRSTPPKQSRKSKLKEFLKQSKTTSPEKPAPVVEKPKETKTTTVEKPKTPPQPNKASLSPASEVKKSVEIEHKPTNGLPGSSVDAAQFAQLLSKVSGLSSVENKQLAQIHADLMDSRNENLKLKGIIRKLEAEKALHGTEIAKLEVKLQDQIAQRKATDAWCEELAKTLESAETNA